MLASAERPLASKGRCKGRHAGGLRRLVYCRSHLCPFPFSRADRRRPSAVISCHRQSTVDHRLTPSLRQTALAVSRPRSAVISCHRQQGGREPLSENESGKGFPFPPGFRSGHTVARPPSFSGVHFPFAGTVTPRLWASKVHTSVVCAMRLSVGMYPWLVWVATRMRTGFAHPWLYCSLAVNL